MKETVLVEFQGFTKSIEDLLKVDSTICERPIKTDKWSVKEIIAHIYRWDVFLLEEAIRTVTKERFINFPNHNEYNAASTTYAANTSVKEVMEDCITMRKTLANRLEALEELLQEPITVNGSTHCPRTNEQYTLLYIIKEFIEHDQSHLRQIESFLKNQRNLV
ncbi:hypothetical protein EJF36_13000 [Bacillus sp. HMF5848]|uniref:DinB family protein n=1 Tax=Bacillus sp. HMF5848 TaxID=2495421 RepID=UPI000F773B35|nr:DinB family protein [Bacillus sp. HMF5848]RSK27718.1 hypothetical protein EJF36_13000 [Bacillus sp. HMF5848]